MSKIGVRELKNRASEIIRAVRERQARYLITYRGKPVGILLPLGEQSDTLLDMHTGSPSAWETLTQLGREIGEGWQADQSSTDLLSETRR